MDRFLTTTTVRKTHLQILAAACLLLASKLREPSCLGLPADLLVYYTDNSISKCDLIVSIWKNLSIEKKLSLDHRYEIIQNHQKLSAPLEGLYFNFYNFWWKNLFLWNDILSKKNLKKLEPRCVFILIVHYTHHIDHTFNLRIC